MKNKDKMDLHLNLSGKIFKVLEQLRSKKSRTKFIEELIQERETLFKVSLELNKIKSNQKRIFALLLLLASMVGIPESDIQKINNRNQGG